MPKYRRSLHTGGIPLGFIQFMYAIFSLLSIIAKMSIEIFKDLRKTWHGTFKSDFHALDKNLLAGKNQ